MSIAKHALKNPKITKAPTTVQFTNLQYAFDYFNRKLFNGELADCLLMFGRDAKRCYGYFHAKQWKNADDHSTCHMISLTPRHLSRPLEEVFGTLVHEMCHLWQEDFGKPSKNGYHNKEWAEKMKEVGLHPSTTGDVDGKETGSKVTHYIVKGGAFYHAFRDMPEDVKLPWVGTAETTKNKVERNKVKYVCPSCESKVWGKSDMNVLCGDCDEQYLPA